MGDEGAFYDGCYDCDGSADFGEATERKETEIECHWVGMVDEGG